MTESVVVEDLTRSRARVIQQRERSDAKQHGLTRKIRVPELAVGLLLMCGGALGAVLLSRSGDSVVVVVGTSHELTRGTKIAKQDLIALEVSASLASPFVLGDQAALLVGQTLLIDVGKSTPLTLAMVGRETPLNVEEALTSAAVRVGNYPLDLAVGDTVRVITVRDISLGELGVPELFESAVTVWSLQQPVDSNDFALVTFRSSLDLAIAVAKANEVHLVVVSQGNGNGE